MENIKYNIENKRIFILFTLLCSLLLSLFSDIVLSAQNDTNYYNNGRVNFLKFTPMGFDKSIEYYRKAIELNPNDYKAYSGLGEVYSYMGYFRFLNKRDYEEFYTLASNNIKKALKLSPNSYEAKRALAINYLHLRWHTKAKSEAINLIKLYPDSPEAYYVYWSSTGKRTNSEYIKKVLSLNQKYVPAHIELANSYFYLDRNYRKAANHYMKSIEIADSPELRNYLGTTFRTQGNYIKAIEQYNKAIDMDKYFAEAYMNLGITLYYMRKYNESINNLEKAVSLNHNFPDSFYFLGNTYVMVKNKIKAVENYKEFLNLAINDNRYSVYVSEAKNSLYKLTP